MSVSPSLRRASAADLDALVALQDAAYAPNRAVLGVEPLPLLADYAEILTRMECWLADGEGALDGALILEPQGDALLIWSVSVSPKAQGSKLGQRLMVFAEDRARALGFKNIILYTGEKLIKNIIWYGRLGYTVAERETLPDRVIVHMRKQLEQV